MTVTLGELAVRFGCELRGDPQVVVDTVGALSHAGPRAVSFLANPKLAPQLKETRAGVVILDAKSAGASPVPALVVANPHATYARVAMLLHPDPPLNPGIHATAAVAASARSPSFGRNRRSRDHRRARDDRRAHVTSVRARSSKATPRSVTIRASSRASSSAITCGSACAASCSPAR